MATLSEKLAARIAALDTEIQRVKANAQAEVARIQETRALLVRAQEQLTPEREQLLALLQREGIL